jgi:hypothetical protein
MTKSQFWCIGSADSTVRLAEWMPGKMDLEQVICTVNTGHRRGGKRLTNLSILLQGQTIEDFVWTWQSECLVQDHVLDLFRRSGFTGFEVKPVKAMFKRACEVEPPRLWELIVTGWAGMASVESGIKLLERCEGCGYTVYSGISNLGAVIDASKWDGSDFFMVWPLPKFIFVSDRAAQVICQSRLIGAVLKQPSDVNLSGGTIGGGRLSYWMPQERARDLGGLLGID